MSAHLFGSVTLPVDLSHPVEFHRFHHDWRTGSGTVLDGWRDFHRALLEDAPLEFMESAAIHLEHFGDQAAAAVQELLGSAWPEIIALGVACRSLQGDDDVVLNDTTSLPPWLAGLRSRLIVRASTRDESPHGGPEPWIVELYLGCEQTHSVNVWVNPDGSLHLLHPADESIDELEAFLGDINHLVPNRPFERIPLDAALTAIRAPADDAATRPGDRAMLHWLLRSPCRNRQRGGRR